MNLRRVLAALVPIAVLASSCGAPGVAIIPRLGFIEASGDMAASSSGSSASSDLEALGLDDTENEFIPRFDFEWGTFQLTVDYMAYHGSGEGTAEADFDLGGTTITAGDDVESELDVDLYSVFASWDFVPGDTIDLGIGLGVTGGDLSGALTSQTTGETAKAEAFAPVPTLGARGEVAFGPLEVGALVRGMAVDTGDAEVTLLDIDVQGKWRLFGLGEELGAFSLIGGYRGVALDTQFEDGNSDVDIDVDLTGPYVGLAFTL